MQRSKVDFPEPLNPITARNSPGSTVKPFLGMAGLQNDYVDYEFSIQDHWKDLTPEQQNILLEGTGEEMLNNPDVRSAYFGI